MAAMMRIAMWIVAITVTTMWMRMLMFAMWMKMAAMVAMMWMRTLIMMIIG